MPYLSKSAFANFATEPVRASADLDMQSDVIVADTINGKRLGVDHPFCFIAKNSHGDPVVIKKLSYIKGGFHSIS
jgi:hypothetical protein